jgi:flagellar motor switch protein FliN/FliY
MTEAAAPAEQSAQIPGPAGFLQIGFLQIWSASSSQVLEQITGSAIPCAVETETPADLPAAGEGDLWLVITSSGALRGEMSMRMAAASTLRLAQIFMSQPATREAQPTAEHREAVVELLRQISEVVSSAAKARWGEVQMAVEMTPAAPSWPPAATFWLRAGDPGPAGMAMEFGLSAALVAQLKIGKDAASKAETASAPSASSSPVRSTNSGQDTGTLDRLMDVQLAMTLRFGSKTLLLREVLDLNPGAVVELDRRVQEPVELLLDGRLIARGEVVVIDGNYGLRVTEVSPIGHG